jgi:hypothetical protein
MPTHWIVEARVNDTRKGVRAAGASRRPSSRAARASSSEDQKGPRDHAGRTSEVRWRTGTATRRTERPIGRRPPWRFGRRGSEGPSAHEALSAGCRTRGGPRRLRPEIRLAQGRRAEATLSPKGGGSAEVRPDPPGSPQGTGQRGGAQRKQSRKVMRTKAGGRKAVAGKAKSASVDMPDQPRPHAEGTERDRALRSRPRG